MIGGLEVIGGSTEVTEVEAGTEDEVNGIGGDSSPTCRDVDSFWSLLSEHHRQGRRCG